MDHDRAALHDRLARVLHERVVPALEAAAVPLDVAAWAVPDDAGAPGEPVDVGVALAARYTPVPPGTRWGRPWGTTWFRVTGQVPAAWRDAPARPGHALEARVD